MNKTKEHRLIWGILLAAFFLRTLLMLLCDGYNTDVTCFVAWSENMVKYGADGFYTGGFFADYPPGYLYYLWGAGLFNQLFGIEPSSLLGLYVLGFLPLCCDLVTAWLAWYLPSRAGYGKVGLLAGAFYALSPAFLFNLGVWKQVDSVIALALLLCFLLLDKNKWYASAALYALAVLIKPQALILGPVLAAGYLLPLLTAKTNRERLHTLLTTAASALCCLAIIFLGALPFQGSQSLFWLPLKYFATMSYYSYGSVNAFNLFSLLGGNWQPADNGWLLNYSQWGTLFIVASVVIMLWLAVSAVKRSRSNLSLLAALFGILVFTLSHGMHERYSLPFVVLLLFGWIKCRDRELFRCLTAQSLLSFFNVAAALWCLEDSTVYGSPGWELCLRLGGLLQVAVCVWLLLCCFRIFGGGNITLWDGPTFSGIGAPPADGLSREQELPWNRRDTLFILLPTLLCAVLSFWGLGATSVPATTWYSGSTGDVELNFSQPAKVSQLWMYSSIGDGFLELWDDFDSESPLFTADTPYGEMYRWQVLELGSTISHLTLRGYDANINELVFVDGAGNTLTPDYVSDNGRALFDEQQLRPERPSSYTGMYFDEIYHARTAYEHLHGMEPYENSHPPLGKLIIMLGIRLFGMNPFGWRFMGTLFGVLLLPLLYLAGRLLLNSREYALLGVVLLSLDFMRYTQSRIATIDTFAVFFILAAYYFMLQWLRRDTAVVPLKSQLLPLALSGLCFALACSVKWVGVYAGVGLAVLFFLRLWRVLENKRLLCLLVGAGFAFFVALPVGIYLLSYLPYYLCAANPHSLADVWGLQGFMLGYHGKLTDTHPFESRWYSWPFIGRPIWYHMGTLLPEGMVSSIALLGNPAVWWSSTSAMVCLGGRKLIRRGGSVETFLLIAFASQFLPWVFISRSTFLYHYFPSLPFAILALCLGLRQLAQWNKKLRVVPFLLVIAALGLFVWFYPLMSDQPVTVEYASSLAWFKSWDFYLGI